MFAAALAQDRFSAPGSVDANHIAPMNTFEVAYLAGVAAAKAREHFPVMPLPSLRCAFLLGYAERIGDEVGEG